MKTFHVLSAYSDLEPPIAAVLPWLHEAGAPYFNWIFGGEARARRTLASWMRRPSSEVSILRMTLLSGGSRPGGGFLALGGAELARCRAADTIAISSTTSRHERPGLVVRIAAGRALFPAVRPDEFYLSKLGVAADARGSGLGRTLVTEYLAAGRAAGFRRFRLDVWAENRVAVRLYHSVGFRVVQESVSAEAGMKYLAMVL